MKLVIATNNEKKLRELQHALALPGIELLTHQQAGITRAAKETGKTFRQNAFLKAQAAYTWCKLPVLADDSGLCVEALNGAPGVDSAIYGAPQCTTDADRNALLLQEMSDITDRTAKFAASFCLILPYSPPRYFDGECVGEILTEPRGTNGFGYDPLFYLPQFGKTMAELSPEEKLAVSHRGAAAIAVKRYLSTRSNSFTNCELPSSEL